MKETTAKIAAKWWADKLRHRHPQNNGDFSQTGALVMGMASMLQRAEAGTRTPEMEDKFEAELAALLMSFTRKDVTLSTDYHPCAELQWAASAACIDLGMASLPWKTYMDIDGDTITVSWPGGKETLAQKETHED